MKKVQDFKEFRNNTTEFFKSLNCGIEYIIDKYDNRCIKLTDGSLITFTLDYNSFYDEDNYLHLMYKNVNILELKINADKFSSDKLSKLIYSLRSRNDFEKEEEKLSNELVFITSKIEEFLIDSKNKIYLKETYNDTGRKLSLYKEGFREINVNYNPHYINDCVEIYLNKNLIYKKQIKTIYTGNELKKRMIDSIRKILEKHLGIGVGK